MGIIIVRSHLFRESVKEEKGCWERRVRFLMFTCIEIKPPLLICAGQAGAVRQWGAVERNRKPCLAVPGTKIYLRLILTSQTHHRNIMLGTSRQVWYGAFFFYPGSSCYTVQYAGDQKPDYNRQPTSGFSGILTERAVPEYLAAVVNGS